MAKKAASNSPLVTSMKIGALVDNHGLKLTKKEQAFIADRCGVKDYRKATVTLASRKCYYELFYSSTQERFAEAESIRDKLSALKYRGRAAQKKTRSRSRRKAA